MEQEEEILTVITAMRNPHDDLWIDGTVANTLGGKRIGTGYKFQAKVYNEGSKFGINKGRVSKLCVRKVGPKGRTTEIITYDRGWDIRPNDEEAQQLLRKILECLENVEKYKC